MFQCKLTKHSSQKAKNITCRMLQGDHTRNLIDSKLKLKTTEALGFYRPWGF